VGKKEKSNEWDERSQDFLKMAQKSLKKEKIRKEGGDPYSGVG